MPVESISQHNHQFTWSVAWDNTIYDGVSCSSPALDSICRAFCRNMKRARSIGVLPIRLVSLVAINEAARIEAKVNLGMSPDDSRTKIGHKDYDPALAAKVSEERKRLIEKWRATDMTGFVDYAAYIGSSGIQNILDSPGREEENEAVQAAMAAMLMGLWTAFESLMQDTWLTAVNAHPIPLAERVLEPSADLGTGQQLKALSMRELVRAGFNLTGAMGDVLLRQRAVDFQSLKTTRLAYKVAWAGEFEPIFEESHTDLANLEATRNLFAHKGGIIDRKFLNRVKKMKNLSGAREGNELLLGGAFVAHCANTVAKCSIDLVRGVDRWLTANANKEPVSD